MLVFKCWAFGPLCVEWHISDLLIQMMEEIQTQHTQTNEFTSDLVNLSIFTFEQSFTQVAGRFDCV